MFGKLIFSSKTPKSLGHSTLFLRLGIAYVISAKVPSALNLARMQLILFKLSSIAYFLCVGGFVLCHLIVATNCLSASIEWCLWRNMSFTDSLGNQAFLVELVAALAPESNDIVVLISKDVEACCSAFCLLLVQFPS